MDFADFRDRRAMEAKGLGDDYFADIFERIAAKQTTGLVAAAKQVFLAIRETLARPQYESVLSPKYKGGLTKAANLPEGLSADATREAMQDASARDITMHGVLGRLPGLTEVVDLSCPHPKEVIIAMTQARELILANMPNGNGASLDLLNTMDPLDEMYLASKAKPRTIIRTRFVGGNNTRYLEAAKFTNPILRVGEALLIHPLTTDPREVDMVTSPVTRLFTGADRQIYVTVQRILAALQSA